MTESQIIIILLTVIGSVFGFYMKLKKDIIAEEKSKEEPLKKLNESIITLNATIKFLTEMIDSLKQRVSNHGKEIDEIKLQNQRHEERLKTLENSIKN